MTAKSSMHDYAIEQMNRLLTTLAFQVHRAAKKPGPDEIHDLRVSIRRFSQGLRTVLRLLPQVGNQEDRPNAEAHDAAHFLHSRSRHHARISNCVAAYLIATQHASAAPGKRAQRLSAAVRRNGAPLERARFFSQVAERIVTARRMKLKPSRKRRGERPDGVAKDGAQIFRGWAQGHRG